MGQGSKNKTVFKLPVEIMVVIGRVSIMYFLLHSTVRYWCIVFIDMGKILEHEEACHHPAFTGNCPTVSLKY